MLTNEAARALHFSLKALELMLDSTETGFDSIKTMLNAVETGFDSIEASKNTEKILLDGHHIGFVPFLE